MTLLTVARDVGLKIALDQPSAMVGATDRELVELLSCIQDTAQMIFKAHDWQALKKIATYTGDGATEDFNLPSDYDRMLVKAKVWSDAISCPLSQVTDADQWLGMDMQNTDLVFGSWILYGGQIHIKNAMASGVTAKHWYMSNLIVKADNSSLKATFTADNDTFRLSERLLTKGSIYRWKLEKGQPYAEQMEDYEDLKEKLIVADKGARKISGSDRRPRDVDYPFPYAVVP